MPLAYIERAAAAFTESILLFDALYALCAVRELGMAQRRAVSAAILARRDTRLDAARRAFGR